MSVIERANAASEFGADSPPLLRGEGLIKRYGRRSYRDRDGDDTAAVRGVTLRLERGRSLGLVGESGSGKTTVGLMLAGLVAPSEGSVSLEGRVIARAGKVIVGAADRRLVQVVFQDSFGSLNPRVRAIDAIGRTLEATHPERRARMEQAGEILGLVGLPRSRYASFAHELSGGERQRVNIARAIAVHPAVIVADEPVAALDVSIQAKILSLLEKLRGELGTSYMFISHDLAVTRHITDSIAVMYAGRIVEQGPADAVVYGSVHPYTQRLVASARGGRHTLAAVAQSSELAKSVTLGCPYHRRCTLATEICTSERPLLRPLATRHEAACHHAEESLQATRGVV